MIRFATASRLVYDVEPHSHPYWEVLCYVEGSGELYVGERMIEFTPGTIVCQPPDIPHRETSRDGFRNIYFITDSFVPPRDGVSVFHDDADGEFEHLMRLGLKNSISERPQNRRILENTVEIINDLLRLWCDSDPQNLYVDRLIDKIIDGFEDPAFDLSAAIGDLGFCGDYVRRRFVLKTGKTPLEFLRELRLNHARTLLERGVGLSVKEIAYRSGFRDEYYFSRIYKKHMGVPPTTHRKA